MSTTLGTYATPSSSNTLRCTADVNTNIEEEAPAPTSISVYLVAKPKFFNSTCAKLED
jgi:predicted component of type VI protein secretion system